MTDKKIKGGIGYYEYLHNRIKHHEKVFGGDTKFIYKEYNPKKNKEERLFFEQNGFKKPYPVASLGIRIAFRENEL